MGFFNKLFHPETEKTTEKYIYITDMVCQNCAEHVTQSLKAIPGVHKVNVNLTKGQAKVKIADSVCDDTLFKAVVNAGYTVTKISLQPKE